MLRKSCFVHASLRNEGGTILSSTREGRTTMSSRTHGAIPHLAALAPPGAAHTAPGPTTEPPSATAETTPAPPGEAPYPGGFWPPCGPPQWKPTSVTDPIAVTDQITVALIDKAAADLQRTHDRTQLSRTDIVNRALSLYEFIDAALYAGAELIVRQDGYDNLLKLL
jgi:hypothetical protein